MPSKFLVEAIAFRSASRLAVGSLALSISGAARRMRVDDHPAALGRVEGVGRRLLAVLGLVGLVGLRADAPHLLERKAGERDAHLGAERGVAGGALEQLLLEEPVRPHEAGARRDQPDLLHLADDHLGAGLDDAAQVDEIGAGGADLGQHRLLIGLLPVDALVGDHGEADLLGGGLEDVGDALAVELLVVEDVHLLRAEALGPLGGDRALDVVGRDRPEVVDVPAGPVDLRLARGRPALLGQPRVGIGRRDLRHVGAVGDRDRDLGGAGIVGADVDDGERIADGLVRVLRLHRAVPLARLRGGVVEVHHLEAVPGDGASGLGDGEVDAVLHAGALGQHRALHRPRRVQAQLAFWALLGMRLGGEGGGGEEGEAERDSARDSHGRSSVRGAPMRPSIGWAV